MKTKQFEKERNLFGMEKFIYGVNNKKVVAEKAH